MIFELTQEQEEKASRFYKEHCARQPSVGAIGGGLTYEFTPTGIGVVTKVVFCRGMPSQAELDVTDYDRW